MAHWGPKETGTKKVIGYHVWRKKRLQRMNSNRIHTCWSRGCHCNKQTILSISLSCMEQIFGNVAHWGPKETGTKKVIGYYVWRKKRLRRMNSNRIQACRSRGLGGSMAAPDFGRPVNPKSTRKADMPNTLPLAPPDFQTFLRPWD